jgi:hypothetical protein
MERQRIGGGRSPAEEIEGEGVDGNAAGMESKPVAGAALGRQGATESTAGSIGDAAAVDGLLKSLTETRASAVEVAPFPTSDLVATVSFIGFAGEPLDTVRIARRAADGRILLENGDGVLRVHGDIELPLTPEDLGFRAKR